MVHLIPEALDSARDTDGRGPPILERASALLRSAVDFRSSSLAASIFVAIGVAIAIPLAVTSVPFGVDDLNHFARIYVRAHIADDPDLARIFRLKDELVPYLGADLLLTPLARVVPILALGRLYMWLLMAGLIAAVAVVRRAFHPRVGLAPAAAALVAYNGLLAWGLIIYLLGVIGALLLFAAWHRWRERPWGLRLLAFAAGSTALYFTHVIAFFAYGVLVVSYELARRRRFWTMPLRDGIVLVGQALPALALFAHAARNVVVVDDGLVWRYDFPGKVLDLVFPFAFGSAAGGAGPDLAIAVLLAGAIALAASRGLVTVPRLILLPMLAMAFLSAVAPLVLFGESTFDLHFPIFVACLFFAGAELTPRGERVAPAIGVAIALLFFGQVAAAAAVTRACDAQYSEAIDAFRALPRGARLVTVVEERERGKDLSCTSLPIFDHMAQLATIERSGYATTFFSYATTVAPRDGQTSDVGPFSAKSFVNPREGYVFWVHRGRRGPASEGLRLVRRGSFFDLWSAAPEEGQRP